MLGKHVQAEPTQIKTTIFKFGKSSNFLCDFRNWVLESGLKCHRISNLKKGWFIKSKSQNYIILWDKIARPHRKPFWVLYPLETCFSGESFHA